MVKGESKILTLDDGEFGRATTSRIPAHVVATGAPVEPPNPAIDRLAALRDVARRLRRAPEADDTLQYVIDVSCECTGSDAGMLTLSAPMSRQFVCGTALGAGPYISVPLRAGGPTFGEIVLTRMAEADEFRAEDETFAELVAEYIAKAVSTLRAGSVISQDAQDFIDRVTEELRPPLSGAVSTIAIATAAEELNGSTRKYLRSAHGDTHRLLNTVDNLMMLAHLRAPRLHELESIPVHEWLERGVTARRAQAEDREVNINYRPSPEAYIVQGVPDQLDNVIRQLLINSIKFTEPGGRIDVTAGLFEGQVKLSVRDTGIGFDQNEASRMTECFARALTATAARIPGMGIGLFLANEIINFHSGRLWLESVRDQGTVAHVQLPVQPDGV
jgi:signal transduction histidine kinase